MKASDIRSLSSTEKERKLSDLKEELFNLRFQHGIGQLENPAKLKQIKRDIARVKTIMLESRQDQTN
ncbi:MAG: 50S ribosomal protein L29 [Desulfobacterales bacterium]|nr:50S ribosomal protein L29 [Desulfobacterales bacterium]MDJ0914206.1 50S ribosomal protein L29 [Desulfobacterales bacterium]